MDQIQSTNLDGDCIVNNEMSSESQIKYKGGNGIQNSKRNTKLGIVAGAAVLLGIGT